MPRPPLRLAFSAASAVVAITGLLGRLDLSLPTALILLVAARASSLSASASPDAPDELARYARLLPAFVLAVAAAVVRSGSAAVADVTGASAVAGLPLLHGTVASIAASWVGIAAGIIVCAHLVAGISRGWPWRQADLLVVVGHGLMLVSAFAGPQVTRVSDLLPWLAAMGAVGASAAALSRWRSEATVRFANLAAVVSLTLMLGAR